MCRKSDCIRIWCRLFCMSVLIFQSTIVVKILFCMLFYCSLIEKHVFHGIKLFLNLFTLTLDEDDAKAQALQYFYVYIVCFNVLGILLYGIVSTTPSKNETTNIIDNLCFLGTIVCMCFTSLLQTSAFLILTIFIGIDCDVKVHFEASFLACYEVLQIVTLSLLLAVFNLRYQEIQKEKSLMFTATLIQNNENSEPLLVH